MKEFRNDIIRSIKFYNQRPTIYKDIKYYKKQENGSNSRAKSINTDGGVFVRQYIIYDVNSMKKFNDYKTRNIIRESISDYLNRLQDLCHIIRPISSYKRR